MKKYSKNTKTKMARILVTGTVLLALSFGALILPLRPSESAIEKRKLAEFPEFSFSSLFNGSFFSGVSLWFSDTFPLRDELVALNYKIQNLLGTSTVQKGFNEGVKGDDIPDAPVTPVTDAPISEISSSEAASEGIPVTEASTVPAETTTEGALPDHIQSLSGIIVCGNAAYEYYNFSQDAADSYARAVNRAASLFEGRAQVYSVIIPTSIDITLDKRVRKDLSVSDQKKAISYMYGSIVPSVRTVELFDTMAEHAGEYIYFRADHHWTGLGAYYAYTQFCAAKGIAALPLSSYTVRSFDNFLGSFYADSGQDPALAATPDVVDTYTPPCNTEMTVTEASGNVLTTPMIYNATSNKPAYKYSAFIYGDNPFTVIENTDMAQGESCILIKDSFGNAFAPLLTYHYKYVYVYDFRYDNPTVDALVTEKGIDDVIIMNNISLTRSAGQVEKLTAKIG